MKENPLLQKNIEQLNQRIGKVCLELNIPKLGSESKLLRPLLGFAAIGESSGDADDRQISMALAAVQMIHEASLFHDDILDAATIRRKYNTTVNHKGHAYALMMGDRYIAAAFKLMAASGSLSLIRLFADSIEAVILGEIQQNSLCGKILDFETVSQINEKKTGALFSFAAAIPFFFEKADSQEAVIKQKKHKAFGMKFGTLYQHLDDLLDYAPHAESGKPPYQDFMHKKWTLVLQGVKGFSWEWPLDKVQKALEEQGRLSKTAQQIMLRIDELAGEAEVLYVQSKIVFIIFESWKQKLQAVFELKFSKETHV